MLSSSIPSRFAEPFAVNATGTYIRTIPTTTSDPNAASLSLGFPPNTAVAIAGGGTPPDIRDFNGILNQSTAWCQWLAAAAPIFYDATFSTAIGGYPKGAMLNNASTNGSYWLNTVENNTTNPDSGGANWTGITLLGLGTAAYKNTSDNTKATVAAVSGSTTAGHLAVFADSNGTVSDGGAVGVLGTAATKTATNNGLTYVASVSGGTTTNHFAFFNDGLGTVADSGFTSASFFQTSNNLSEGNATTMRTNLGLKNGAITTITVSSSPPSGSGTAGDIWIQI